MDFKDQYKHPLWQKKRLEVLEHSGFICQSCESEDKTIHVHHRRYIKGRRIWEYDVSEFDVLCEDCHAETHAFKEILMMLIAQMPSYSMISLASLVGGFVSVENDIGDVKDSLKSVDSQMFEAGIFAFVCKDYAAQDIAELKNMSPDVIADLAKEIREYANGQG